MVLLYILFRLNPVVNSYFIWLGITVPDIFAPSKAPISVFFRAKYYKSGYMIYVTDDCADELSRDVRVFLIG